MAEITKLDGSTFTAPDSPLAPFPCYDPECTGDVVVYEEAGNRLYVFKGAMQKTFTQPLTYDDADYRYTLSQRYSDASTASITYTLENNIPIYYIVDFPGGNLQEIHYVVTEVKVGGTWISVDTTTPNPPTITLTGTNINTTTPTFTGTADPGSTVRVYDGTSLICTTTTGTGGSWSCTPSTPLSPGDHTITVTVTDATGKTSLPSTPVIFTILLSGTDDLQSQLDACRKELARYTEIYGKDPDIVYPLPPTDFYENNISELVNIMSSLGTKYVSYTGSGTCTPECFTGFDGSASYLLFTQPSTASKFYLQHRGQKFEFSVQLGITLRCPSGTSEPSCMTGANPIRGVILSHGRLMVLFAKTVVSTSINQDTRFSIIPDSSGSGMVNPY